MRKNTSWTGSGVGLLTLLSYLSTHLSSYFDDLTIHTFRPTSFYLQLQIPKYPNTNTCTWVLPRSSRGRTGEMVRGPTWPKSPSPRSARSHSRASGPGGSWCTCQSSSWTSSCWWQFIIIIISSYGRLDVAIIRQRIHLKPQQFGGRQGFPLELF